MRLPISQVIKRLRKEKNITQEELANILGVTYQSVSRWENEIAYPDVELLPMIARYFEVTTDLLLGTDEMTLEHKCKEYKKEIKALINSFQGEKAIQLCKKAVKEFPADVELKWRLMWLYYHIKGLEYSQGKIEEMRLLAQFVIYNDRTNIFAPRCVQIMIEIESEENLEKWTKYTGKDFDYTLPSLLTIRYQKRGEFDKHNMQNQANLVEMLKSIFARYIGRKLNSDGNGDFISRIEGQKIILSIIDNLRDPLNEKDGWLRERAFAYCRLASAYFGIGEKENGYKALEKSLDLYEILFALPNDTELSYNSAILDMITWKKADFNENNEKEEFGIWFDEKEGWSTFAPLRNEDRFIKCIDKVKRITK